VNIQDIALYSFFFIIIGWGSKRIPFLPLLCVLLGITWGFLGSRPPLDMLQLTAKIALVFFLFLDSSRLHIPKILRYQSIRLPTIGFFITLVLGMFLTKLFFSLSWTEAFVIALPLLALDAKLTPAALASDIPSRVTQMLNVEASFTGIFAFFLLSIVHLPHPFHFFIDIFFPIIAGVGISYICGLVGKTALECGWVSQAFFRGTIFLIPFAIFAFCDLFDSNGFIGVIAAGLTFGHSARSLCGSLFDLSRRQGLLLFYLLVIFFGIVTLQVLSTSMTWIMILFALLFLFGVRFLAVFISLLGSRFQWITVGYFTFFAPKGLIPIITALLFTEYFSFPNENLMLSITLITVLFSLLIHTLFSYPLSHWYAHAIAASPDAKEHLPTVSLPKG